MDLNAMGFCAWFAERAAELDLNGCDLARVCAVDRGSCRILSEAGEVPAELSGKLSFHIESPEELPCVGDWVGARHYDGGAAAIIHHVLPRRSFLRRRTPGASARYQMIAANVDAALIVQSGQHDFNPARLERYLVAAADGRVEPVVLLTKTDLLAPEETERSLEVIRSVTGARALAVSCVTGEGLGALRQALAPGRTCCLLGSSGAGKTTLLNRLLGREAFETGGLSGTGEGTHTTTRRQLVTLDQGALLIDTPGMREFGLMGAEGGLELEFADIAAHAALCRYADCTHLDEPGCAVRAAVEGGEIAPARYAGYLKLRKESEHHALSRLEKRRKDKAFGRMVREVKKGLKR
ncbi:MAG TPA: ribosome small subunit-dependent GTPase A [Humidesulfovibrio sp.]|uniref:ribosome small subunit-dependent GTPase A n=1 Tax=Humidesulfovibrio sp. TaxID=2910988 RepID=UPI002C941972|nr:ribosome small subunit-dependent GTPase A [Humidesulfovibrio sp.]HWR04609.1 ribosome small subunit-dependent GTPase A [Humidesulfovibrio sp.]